jgi:hypothetical protein
MSLHRTLLTDWPSRTVAPHGRRTAACASASCGGAGACTSGRWPVRRPRCVHYCIVNCAVPAVHGIGMDVHTPSGAVKEVILRVTERAQKEVIARVGLGFGRCCP